MARGGSNRGSGSGRGRGIGRGRGRGRAAQERPQTQDYPNTPLLRSRGVVPQLSASPPSGSVTRNRPLRSAVRCLRGNRETAVAVLPSQPAEDGLEDVKPSILAGSRSEHGIIVVQPPSLQNVEGDTQPLGGNYEVPRLEITAAADHVPPSLSHSQNMTEFARRVTKESDIDHDEIVSAPGDDYECISGRKVKKEIAHLVRAIIEKYGDIISDCNVRSHDVLSFLLERMCNVYRTLEEKKLFALTRDEVTIMRDELQLCEQHKLKVGWLLERLQQISEAMSSSRAYLMLKEEAEACMQSKKRLKIQVEQQRRHIDFILKNIAMSEKKMEEDEAKAYKCMQKASEIKTKVKSLLKQSLVDGLL